MSILNPERVVVENIRAVTASTTITKNDYIVTCVHSIVVNLPHPQTVQGCQFMVKKTSSTAGYVTIQPGSGFTIDGDNNMVINNEWESIIVYSNGVNYFTGPNNSIGDVLPYSGSFNPAVYGGQTITVVNGLITSVS